ncbi:tyrosine recombinase XerC [Tepidimonas charontis]|uniref:Tyrosine recombinase XerC n=1 Tax=Tepidimonas charontis TaxID=2267262 RepID=A0A554XIU2_9BURK|nr:tyrosine recombinase XerC [Tepidimonas charontis]TSE35747.1 Tyrosine recombinase XerC [Tepidimonas charontis]
MDADASLIEAYLTHVRVEKRLAARTLALYARHLQELHARARAAGVALAAVEPALVRRWVAQMHAQGRQPRGLALVLSCWRGFYTWLGRQGRITRHPLVGVRAPKADKPLPKALSVEAALRLVTQTPPVAPGPHEAVADALRARDQALGELLYGSGLRLGELLALDVQPGRRDRGWVDLEAGEAHVLGKGGRWRTVPVGAAALAALRRWLAQRPALAPAAHEPALFVGARGARLTPQVARRQLAAWAQAAGVPQRVHPHMLRHSFASHVLQSSGDLRAVQELLGHADIRTTQIYTRLDFQHLARVYEAAHPRAHSTPAASAGGASPSVAGEAARTTTRPTTKDRGA